MNFMSDVIGDTNKTADLKRLMFMEMGLDGLVCNEYIFYKDPENHAVLLKVIDGILISVSINIEAEEAWLKAWQLRN